jgi:hypothetical protein
MHFCRNSRYVFQHVEYHNEKVDRNLHACRYNVRGQRYSSTLLLSMLANGDAVKVIGDGRYQLSQQSAVTNRQFSSRPKGNTQHQVTNYSHLRQLPLQTVSLDSECRPIPHRDLILKVPAGGRRLRTREFLNATGPAEKYAHPVALDYGHSIRTRNSLRVFLPRYNQKSKICLHEITSADSLGFTALFSTGTLMLL